MSNATASAAGGAAEGIEGAGATGVVGGGEVVKSSSMGGVQTPVKDGIPYSQKAVGRGYLAGIGGVGSDVDASMPAEVECFSVGHG